MMKKRRITILTFISNFKNKKLTLAIHVGRHEVFLSIQHVAISIFSKMTPSRCDFIAIFDVFDTGTGTAVSIGAFSQTVSLRVDIYQIYHISRMVPNLKSIQEAL